MAGPPELTRTHIRVSLDLDGVEFQRDLADDVPISSAIDEEFMEQSDRFAWWATVVELARDKVARTKYQLDRIYALKDHSVRLDLTANKAKITEKIVENSVITSKEYQECMFELLEAKKQLGLAQAGKEALIQRKDMLISLGANLRAEGTSSNLSILKDAARKRWEDKAAEKKRETEGPATGSDKKINKKPPVGKKPVGK